jgi:uncharacterized membrane protein
VHFVRGIPGIERARVHEHEQAGDWATWAGSVAGVLALLTLLLMRRRRGAARTLSIVTMLAALFAFVVAARAATLGGQIRHPEIRAGFVPPPAPPRPAGAPHGDEGDGD